MRSSVSTSHVRPQGRPTAYTDKLGDEIIDRHSNGETLAAICRSEGMPHVRTVLRWAASTSQFSKQYALARLFFADAVFDEALSIADGHKSGARVKAKTKEVGNATKVEVARDRLRVDTRLRLVSKINPTKYGDRVAVHHSGAISMDGVDDATLNLRIEKKLHELGVINLLKSFALTAEQLSMFLVLFRVTELPSAPAPMRLLPGEIEVPQI